MVETALLPQHKLPLGNLRCLLPCRHKDPRQYCGKQPDIPKKSKLNGYLILYGLEQNSLSSQGLMTKKQRETEATDFKFSRP